MGRISKRKAAGKANAVHVIKRYKAGIYARLSSDQNMYNNESIEVQIELARKYVCEFNQRSTGEVIDIVQCYTDLGKTGSNFEREGFLRLLQDIRLGEINCVIVKDLSRFGRNYLEAGNYIEKIFPFLGVRFIAVSDEYDTGKAASEHEKLTLEIKNLVNDMYARDFSKKAKLQLKQRREEGSYVGGSPPYGYIAAWKDRRRVLIPDEAAAAIVHLIYERFVEEESYAAVADELNRRKINPPYIYKKTREVYYSGYANEYKGWHSSSVERLIKSKTYSGMLVQGKTSITARDERNRIHKPEEEWVVTRASHQPLIEKELYQRTEEMLEKYKNKTAAHRHPAKGYPIEENIFDSVLYCGVCGRKMTRSSYVKQYAHGDRARIDRYLCLNASGGRASLRHGANRISKAELVDILLYLIRLEFSIYLDRSERYMEYGNRCASRKIKQAEAALRKTEGGLRRFLHEEGSTYMNYRLGYISQDDYEEYKVKAEDRLTAMRRLESEQKNEIAALQVAAYKYLAAIKALYRLKSGKELTKDMIGAFISKIYVYCGKRIEVIFTFSTDCMKGEK